MTSTLTALKRVLAVIAITSLLSALTDNSASASPTLTPDLMSARELQNALALYQSLQVKVKAGEKLDAGSVRRLEALRLTILARGGQLPTVGVVEPVSRLIVWSEVLQKQLPVRNGTRILVEGEIATVTETLSPYQVQFLRTGGGNGLLTGRREYPSVYATIEVRGIELKHSSIFNGDGVFANGVHVGVVEAIFDDASVFIRRANGQIESIGRFGSPEFNQKTRFTFQRTSQQQKSTSCNLSF